MNRIADNARAEYRIAEIRQRIRTRYPILKDGTVGHALAHLGIAASVAELATLNLRPRRHAAVISPAPVTQEHLRELITLGGGIEVRPARDKAFICAMAAAPKKVHVYWELPETTRAIVLRDLHRGGQSMALRFYDVTGKPEDNAQWNHAFDVDVTLDDHGRYCELWAAGRDYKVEIGLRREDGMFLPLACSRRVHVPSDFAGANGLRFVPLELSGLSSQTCTPLMTPELTLALPGTLDWPLRDAEAERAVRSLYRRFRTEGPRALRHAPRIERRPNDILETEYAARAARPAPRPSLSQDARAPRFAQAASRLTRPDMLAVRLDNALPKTADAVAKTVLPEAVALTYPPVLASEKPAAFIAVAHVARAAELAQELAGLRARKQAEEAAQAARMAALREEQAAALREAKALEEELVRRKAEEDALLRETAAAQALAASECATNAFSDTADAHEKPVKHKQKMRKILSPTGARKLLASLEEAGVELEAELILRGRVKPGKKVRIGGQIIETDPEGRFCVSCVIRDGKLHVPVEAVEAEVVVARADVSVDLGAAVQPA